MVLFHYRGYDPQVGRDVYISESAQIIGNVSIGDGCYVGPGAIIRGDYGRIEIGEGSAVEENCVIHARPKHVCRIGKSVTIGHGALIHNATIDDFAVVGMGAVVSNDATIGRWAIVAEGCVVKSSQEVPAEKVVAGVPAQIIGEVTDKLKEPWMQGKMLYVKLAKEYPNLLRRL